MDKDSISVANNLSADTFGCTSDTKRENANAIFTIDKLDKLDNLADALKDLTINNSKYYVSQSDHEGRTRRSYTRS